MALPVIRLNAAFEGEIEYGKRFFGAPFALPGDHVQFKLKRGKKKSFKVVKIERAESYADDLRLKQADCPYYGQCGGCRGQHLQYDFQLDLKCAPVEEQLKELMGQPALRIAAPDQKSYRHRMDFVVDGSFVGLRAPGDFRRFIDIENCLIQSEPANQILRLARSTLANHPSAARTRQAETGLLKYITIRSGVQDQLVILTICSDIENDMEVQAYQDFQQEFANNLKMHIPAASLIECSNPAQSEVSAPAGGRALLGKTHYLESLGSLQFNVPYDAFFQPNPPAFDLLLNHCMDALQKELDLPASQALLKSIPAQLTDLYCGSGVLAAIATARFKNLFKKVYGFEFVESATRQAPDNLKHFNGELHFNSTDLNKIDAQMKAHLKSNSQLLLIADPPRAGLSPALCETIRDQKPAPYFLYISCNPQTQLRDLSILKDSYEMLTACLVDCYPHTPHLEQAVLLKLRSGL